uniref:GPR158/179 extracellular domain-containing protein n=1 Tax=Photinus pyralis TaxID=7054 RepID=A0A1Y1KQJ4_PHOPY
MERFQCGKFHMQHLFFGWDSLKARLEFKGVVAVTMDLTKLDINQCPDKAYVPNAFKGTNKCDKKSSYCVPILGRGYETGGYKCECKQGYEYPFEDQITYYDGQLVEGEFINLVDNNKTRFHTYQCRIAAGSTTYVNFMTLFVMTCLSLLQI